MNPIPFRIKIGVTGHRNNLPDMVLLKSKIREALDIDEWKNKTVAVNSVFSPLMMNFVRCYSRFQVVIFFQESVIW